MNGAPSSRSYARSFPSIMQRILPLLIAGALILLVFFAFWSYRQSASILAQQHNLQHWRLIETVSASMENRFVNMQAAYSHYAELINASPHPHLAAKTVVKEVQRTFSTIVSNSFIAHDGHLESLDQEESAALFNPDSITQLKLYDSDSSPHVIFVRSNSGEGLLLFLSPVQSLTGNLVVVVPLKRIFATYRLNDTGFDDDYVWVLDRQGTLIYHRHHPEMVGNNIFSLDPKCKNCHSSFELEKRMIENPIGYGRNEVPKGSAKIVAYVPFNFADLHWTLAVSEGVDETSAVLKRDMRSFTLVAILLSLAIFSSSVYITRANHLRRQAEQEAVHLKEEHLLQQQLNRKNRQLQEAERFATVGRMAAQVAHEIKNPLSSISLNTELLGDELQGQEITPSPEARQLIQSILAEIDLLTKTIDEYLQFARFPKLQRELTSLEEVFDGLRQLLQEEAVARRIDLQFSLSSSVPRVSADPKLLRQALLNLIRNSIEAIESQGWIRVQGNRQNRDVQIEVCDSGPGIAPENLSMLFEPFFTTKSKGTGLGLSVTRHIILEHGGSISYEPNNGAAARFLISLPIDDHDLQAEGI